MLIGNRISSSPLSLPLLSSVPQPWVGVHGGGGGPGYGHGGGGGPGYGHGGGGGLGLAGWPEARPTSGYNNIPWFSQILACSMQGF